MFDFAIYLAIVLMIATHGAEYETVNVGGPCRVSCHYSFAGQRIGRRGTIFDTGSAVAAAGSHRLGC